MTSRSAMKGRIERMNERSLADARVQGGQWSVCSFTVRHSSARRSPEPEGTPMRSYAQHVCPGPKRWLLLNDEPLSLPLPDAEPKWAVNGCRSDGSLIRCAIPSVPTRNGLSPSCARGARVVGRFGSAASPDPRSSSMFRADRELGMRTARTGPRARMLSTSASRSDGVMLSGSCTVFTARIPWPRCVICTPPPLVPRWCG